MPASYITGTHHAATLTAALDAFHRALTRRWREQVCDAILDGQPYPTALRAEAASGQAPLWDHNAEPAQYHLRAGTVPSWPGSTPVRTARSAR